MSYFDEKESQSRAEREQALFSQLQQLLSLVQSESAYYFELFKDIDLSSISDRHSLAQLPLTRKSALIELQSKNGPLAGIPCESATIGRLFQSPGPINDPEGVADDWWRMGRAFYAAGFRAGDLVQNCLSYHLTPGGFIMDSGARACGCTVIPAGPGQTEQQLDVIESLKPQGYCGTPSFLNILLDKAEAMNRDVRSISKALVTGEALLPPVRAALAAKGIDVLQAYATADLGLIAYETVADQGLVVAEDIIVEIVRPGTNEPVADGEVGEVVVTNFCPDYPLIRFATGDLSAIIADPSSCGRTNIRLRGWLGRADQTTKVKGMFVHPQQIQRVVNDFSTVVKSQLQVSSVNLNDQMTLICEIEGERDDAQLIADLKQRLKDVTKLSGEVQLVAKGTLANDGKVINDCR